MKVAELKDNNIALCNISIWCFSRVAHFLKHLPFPLRYKLHTRMNSFSYEIFLVRLNVIKMLYNGFHALIQISGFMLLFLDLCIYIYIYINKGAGHIIRISSKSWFISLIPFKKWNLYNVYIHSTQTDIFQVFISFNFDDYNWQLMKTPNSVSQKIRILWKGSILKTPGAKL